MHKIQVFTFISILIILWILFLDQVVKNRPVPLLPPLLDNEKGKTKNLLKSGVQALDFSPDGKYIASVNGNLFLIKKLKIGFKTK